MHLKDREFNYLFIGGGVALLLILLLYLSIHTVTQVFSFFLLSGLILGIFIIAFLELVIVERLIDYLAEVMQHAKGLLYLVSVLGLAGLIFILVNGFLFFYSLERDLTPCQPLLNSFSSTIYDTTKLADCPLTTPLAAIVPEDSSQINTATQNLSGVIANYLDIFADEASLGMTSVFTLGTAGSLLTLTVLLIRIAGFVLLKFLFTNYGSLSAFQREAPDAERSFQQGHQLYQQGHYQAAFAAYRQAIEQKPNDRRYLSTLWRLGCLQKNSPEIIQLCDTLLPFISPANEGPLLDTRATAHALTDQHAQAIQDFLAFIVWAKARGVPETHLDKRRAWIESLEQGRNPFDEETLRGVLGE